MESCPGRELSGWELSGWELSKNCPNKSYLTSYDFMVINTRVLIFCLVVRVGVVQELPK